MTSQQQIPYVRCLNCHKSGHMARNCQKPVCSYGVLAVRTSGLPQSLNTMIDRRIRRKSEPPDDIGIRYLMICRKDTIGYIEFVRGKYDVADTAYIRGLMEQMTTVELEKCRIGDFDVMWNDIFGLYENPNPERRQKLYKRCLNRYQKMRMTYPDPDSGKMNTRTIICTWDQLTEGIVPWETPEWGFPKGKRMAKERNIVCARREFSEETGYQENEFEIVNQAPLVAGRVGTNGLLYNTILYFGEMHTDRQPTINPTNPDQAAEISDIGFFTYDEAVALIRPYCTELLQLLEEANTTLRKVCVSYYGTEYSNC